MGQLQHNMKNIINTILVLLVTITITRGEREDIQDIVREMLVETNAKVASMEQEMKDMNDTFEKKIKDMNDTFWKELKTRDNSIHMLEKELDTRDYSNAKLEREVSFLKEPPFSFFCGYKRDTSISSATITYDSLLYSYTSTPDTASLDIVTGIFTSGWGGTYTVTWSLGAWNGAGDHAVGVYLRKNGDTITESLHESSYRGPSGGVTDQGGRTLLVRLERGDTLDLWCEDCSAHVYDTTFCITMSSFEYE